VTAPTAGGPVPAWLTAAAERAGVTLDIAGGTITVYRGVVKVGVTWGPSADGDGAWFASRAGQTAVRLADRDAGLRHILVADPRPAAVPADRRQCLDCRLWRRITMAGVMFRHKRPEPGRRHMVACGGGGYRPLAPAPRTPAVRR
jgi:hypothetical protein